MSMLSVFGGTPPGLVAVKSVDSDDCADEFFKFNSPPPRRSQRRSIRSLSSISELKHSRSLDLNQSSTSPIVGSSRRSSTSKSNRLSALRHEDAARMQMIKD